jgi:hypothetical protein
MEPIVGDRTPIEGERGGVRRMASVCLMLSVHVSEQT